MDFYSARITEVEAQLLANQIEKFTISSLRNDEVIGLQNGRNLADFPPEVLCNIFSFVGSKSTNPAPTDNFMEYLRARDPNDYQNRSWPQVQRDPPGKLEWTAKTRDEYAVRNLMSLRRVCSKFEDIINNQMVPGIDFDFLMIDVKIQGNQETPRAVVVFKYGGDGSRYPATHLRRIRRYNEIDFEHIQKFERIRNLYITDMVLTEELFETILRLDLTKATTITFERVLDVNFNEDINIVNYIQNFLNTLNSPANVFFNSNVFNPNVVLFGLDENNMEVIEDEATNAQIRDLEENMKRHKMYRAGYKNRTNFAEFRRYRAFNVVNNILHSKQYISSGIPEKKSEVKMIKKQLKMDLDNLTKNRGSELKKAGKWHLRKVFELLEKQPATGRKKLLYHLKMLKKISGECPLISTDEEMSIVRQWNETRHRDHLIQQFPFLAKFQLKSRLYSITRPYSA
ncbi:unnamed protein product [Caenorhabditis brenneri]